MKNMIKIGDQLIGRGNKPFIIAEMSGNHNQSLTRALDLVDAAADSGASAVKLQTYKPETMTLDINQSNFVIKDNDSLWNGRTLYDLYREAMTPWEWHEPIFKRCEEKGILCFSSPFDETSLVFLEELGVPCYKIASFENIDIPLIKKIAKTGKPIIASTGMANISEIYDLVETVKNEGNDNLILLKCTSTYPASPQDTNIITIPHMRELFNLQVGLSDHTMGIGVSIASVALGATVIEKHFTLNRSDGGVDSAFSLEPDELKNLVIETERAWLSLGEINYGGKLNESKSKQFRRSVIITEDLDEGDILTEQNTKCLRPGHGLSPKYYELILGKKITSKVNKGTGVTWQLLKD